MTNLEKVKQIIGFDIKFEEASEFEGRPISAHYTFFKRDDYFVVNSFIEIKTDNHLAELCKGILKDWKDISDADKLKLAIIMIEELTGLEHELTDEFNEFFGHHEKTINLEWHNANHEWGFKNSRWRRTSVPNDWLPYLHLAGNIFKESE